MEEITKAVSFMLFFLSPVIILAGIYFIDDHIMNKQTISEYKSCIYQRLEGDSVSNYNAQACNSRSRKFHRSFGLPAHIEYKKNGEIFTREFYINGEESGPTDL